jgi:hypothetical protein
MKKLKVCSWFLLIALTCFFVLSVGLLSKAPAAPIFSDDFESYAQGTFPGARGWVIIHNGAGDPQQYVDTSQAASGTQSFRTMGSYCWAASLSKSLTIPNRVRLEAKVFVDQVVACGCSLIQTQVGLWRSDDSMYAGAIIFGCDGKIYAMKQSATGPPDWVLLTTYSAGSWYALKVDYDYTSKTFDVFIDGVLRGQAIPILDDLTDKMPNAVRVGAAHGSSPIAWFDDVKVSELTCVSPPSDLVSWWSGDNTANDIIGSNHGTMMGGATFAPGMVGEAFSFDGAEANFVEIPNSSELNPSGAFSVDGWFYIDPAANAGKIATLVAKTEGSTNNGWALYFDDRWSTKSLKFVLGTILELPNAIPAANWYHIAGVFDPSPTPNSKLYINGAPVASVNSGGAQPNGLTVRIGAMHWTDAYHQGNDRLNGKADEVEFFNRALTAEEVAAIYNAGSAGKCKPCTSPPSGMVGWWSGDGHPFDLVGSNNGTLQGAATYAAGKVGNALSFDGSSGTYVSIPQSANLPVRGTNSFTIDAWVKNADGSMFNVFAFRPSNPIENLQFFIDATQTSIWVPEHMLAQINHNVDSTKWNHFAYVRDGNTWRFYVNGVQVGPDIFDAVDLGNPTSTQNIGGPGCACGQWANGQIDEVEIFNRALSGKEIAAIHAAGSAGKCRPCFTPPSNLVSWWKGENNANDSADKNHGTVHGATFAAGKVGQAFSFDGEDDYVEIPNSASLNPGSAFTVDGWFYIDPNSPENSGDLSPFVAKSSSGSAEGGWWLIFDDRDWAHDGSFVKSIRFSVMTGTPGEHNQATAPNLIPSAGWYHIAGVYDQSATPKAKLYLNGALAAQSIETYTYLPNSIAIRIGAMHDQEYYGGTQNWKLKGLADEVEFFNRALSAEEIAAIYAAGSAGKCTYTSIYVSKDGLCGGNKPCFLHIQNGIASASIPATIKITGETYTEDILLDFSREVTLQGGWDTNFTSNASYTTINGSITITNGTMIIENITLK